MVAKPTGITVRAYNVGFGDCFLLTFQYAAGDKHVLIDFGTTSGPKKLKGTGTPKLMLDIAKHIQSVTGGRLDAVIATHRHRDHISGFTRKKGKGTGDLIAEMAKDALILMPWTEHPKLAEKAIEPVSKTKGPLALGLAAVKTLDSMQALAENVAVEAVAMKKRSAQSPLDVAPRNERRTTAAAANEDEDNDRNLPPWAGTIGKRLLDVLEFVGQANVKNREAVESLLEMSTPAKHRYLAYGSKSGLEAILPGVTIYVLGPPTAKDHAAIMRKPVSEHDEYWNLQAMATAQAANRTKPLFGRRSRLEHRHWPRASRWFIRRLRGIYAQQLLSLVRMVDNRINNTSLILLFEVGNKRLLFPGDAQIEDWEWALNKAKNKASVRKRLRDVTFYKVGHHGSLNATPRSVWDKFRGKKKLNTVVSTRSGKHSNSPKTAVPRKTLMTALEQTKLHNTEKLGGKAPKFVYVIPV
jgi:hypothetical protein